MYYNVPAGLAHKFGIANNDVVDILSNRVDVLTDFNVSSSLSSTVASFEYTLGASSFIEMAGTGSNVFFGNKNGSFSVRTSGSGFSDKFLIDAAGNTTFSAGTIRQTNGISFDSIVNNSDVIQRAVNAGTTWRIQDQTGQDRLAINLGSAAGTVTGDWRFNSRVGINVAAQSFASQAIYGLGTTYSTYPCAMYNSAGTTTFYSRDDGAAYVAGNLGVGANPNSTALINMAGNGVSNLGIDMTLSGTSTANNIRFFNDNGLVGSITTSGTATAYNTASDPRYKIFKPLPTDEEIDIEFQKIYSSFRIFDWKNGGGENVWGFDAHAAIDTGCDIGTEGQGPRDLDIGDVYETEEIPEITEEVTEEVQVIVTKTREVKNIEVIDGVPTQVISAEDYEEPVFEEMGVVDERGNTVMQTVESDETETVVVGQDEEGNDITEEQPIMVNVPLTHKVPVTKTVTKTVITQEAQTIEHKVTPAGVDQSKAVPVLLAKVEQLERRLKTLEAITRELEEQSV